MKNCKTEVDAIAPENDQTRRRVQPHARVVKPDPQSAEHVTRLLVELPGVAQGDLEITLEEESLTIRGKTRTVELPAESELCLSEFAADVDYERSFRVSSEVDTDGIEAQYENGVLTLSLPRHKPRRRSISVS